MRRGFQVCVICNHSFILKLCIIIVHTLKMCTPYFVNISYIFTFFTGVELRHFFIRHAWGVSGLCNMLLQQFSLLYIQSLHNDCSYIEDVHHLFCAHFMIFYSILGS